MPFRQKFFTEYSTRKGLFYGSALIFVFSVAVIVTLEPFVPGLWCNEQVEDGSISYENPSYVYYPCRHTRLPHLMFLTPEECDFGRRLVSSVVLGGIIGWERRQADRPAGIRTMSLVSLASCLFTICSAFAFISGPMGWDASRISAAIPSGVGFLGAGLIFKEAQKDDDGGVQHVVHGLTTATSVWLSAAVGVGCGGALYFVSAFTTAIMLLLLRFGPRQHSEEEDAGFASTSPPQKDALSRPMLSGGAGNQPSQHGVAFEVVSRETDELLPKNPVDSERSSNRLRRLDSKSASTRNRAALSSMM